MYVSDILACYATLRGKVFSSKFWNFDETLAGRQSIYLNLTSAIQGLRDITPSSGAYQVRTVVRN